MVSEDSHPLLKKVLMNRASMPCLNKAQQSLENRGIIELKWIWNTDTDAENRRDYDKIKSIIEKEIIKIHNTELGCEVTLTSCRVGESWIIKFQANKIQYMLVYSW